MGKPAETEAALLKASAVPEERTAAIGFMQPEDAPVIPTPYARKRHADMEAFGKTRASSPRSRPLDAYCRSPSATQRRNEPRGGDRRSCTAGYGPQRRA